MNRSRPHRSEFDRRQFLSRVARGAAGVAAGVAAEGVLAAERAAPAAEGTWKMRLSCSSINFMSLSIEQACQRIAALGFEAIDVWSAHAGCPHLDDVLNRLGPEGLTELLAKNHLKRYAFSVYRGGYPKYAELLGKCGGGVAVRSSAGPCDPKDLVPRMRAFFEALKPEIELAEKHDSYLAIENHGHALLDSLDSFKAFVDLNTHPRVGIALAPYHVQGLEQSVEEAIGICGKQLLFFYAWQRAPGVEQLPGLGPTDCTPWIAALAQSGYGWYVNPFMHHEPEPDAMSKALAKSCAYLRQCYAKVAR
jgi:sugar phosphate isomerase/epimerase